jgi:hypothetical protein
LLFSIGYQAITIDYLDHVAARLDAVILDVRGRPISRKKGFGGKQLAEHFGPSRYAWRGAELGNRGKYTTTPAGLASLAEFDGEDAPDALLLCVCDAPGECHRHTMIASKLPFDVAHIWRREVVLSSELTRMMLAKSQGDAKAVYQYSDLAALLGE